MKKENKNTTLKSYNNNFYYLVLRKLTYIKWSQCVTRCRLNEYNYVENIEIQSTEWPILDESYFCEIIDKPLGIKMVYQDVCTPRNNYNRTPGQHITICTPKMFNLEKQQLSSQFVTIFTFCWKSKLVTVGQNIIQTNFPFYVAQPC